MSDSASDLPEVPATSPVEIVSAEEVAQAWAEVSRVTAIAKAKAAARTEWVQAQRPLVFIHIPKTAGTAFTAYLLNNLSEEAVAPAFTGDYSVLPFDDPTKKLFWGHFGYRRSEPYVPNGRFITFLRDPVKRSYSQYLSWHNPNNLLPDDPWRKVMTPEQIDDVEFAQKADFSEFVLCSDRPHLTGHLWDTQTLYLTAPGTIRGTPAFLEGALAALDALDFVGIVEEFEMSIVRFRQTFPGFGPFAIAESQENRSKAADVSLTAQARDRLEELIQCDRKLYAAAVERWGPSGD